MADELNTQDVTPVSDTPKPATPPEPKEEQESKGLSQEEVNKLIGQTRKEARERAHRELLESLGVTDLDTAKTRLQTLAEKEAAELSETEKIQRSLDAALKAKQDAEAAVEQMKAQRIADMQQAAFVKAASASGAKDADDLYILVMAKNADEFKSAFNEDGSPDESRMGAFIKQVQSQYATYFGTVGAGSPSNIGGLPPTSKAQTAQMAAHEIAKKFGRM